MNKTHINLADFTEIYEENQDGTLEFRSISGGETLKVSLNSMINAVKTFDHQGTGFINTNELKFSKKIASIDLYLNESDFFSTNRIG